VVEEADRLAYVLALESTPYRVVTTLVSEAKSHQSDSRSAYEPARAALIKPECAAGAACPWPSVKQPTVRTDRRNCAHRPSQLRTPTVVAAQTDRPNRADGRPLYVRGQRNMTVHSATR
jgi:hypothetical protein